MNECAFGCIDKTKLKENEDEDEDEGGKEQDKQLIWRSGKKKKKEEKSIEDSQYIIAEQNLNEKVADPLIKWAQKHSHNLP